MSNPSIPNIPGIDAMTDTLDFVKNLWGGMNIPGMNIPSMSIPGMIMPTLSVEEINKQISDLKTVESWLTLNMNMLRSTIQALEVQSATISTLQSMGAALSAAVSPNPEAGHAAKKTESPAEPPEAAKEASAAAAKKPAHATDSASPPLANPAIWWNMLQDQFKQAVDTAMASEPVKPAAKPAAPASKPEAKAAPKKAPAPRKPKAAKPKES